MKLVIAYDGAAFAGSQMQAGQRTVQGELEEAIARLIGRPERTVFAGRTDAGVHAAGQVVSLVDGRPDLDEGRILRALNDALPEDLAVVEVARHGAEFHARFDASWREYRYRIWSGNRQPLVRGQIWHRTARLSMQAMERAAARLDGEHDFAAFAGGGNGVPWSPRRMTERGTRRTILNSAIAYMEPWWGATNRDGVLIDYRVRADGFLPNMVRNIVGTLVEIGRGVRSADWMDELLAGRDRRAAAMTAPPQGLVLWSVGYDQDGLYPVEGVGDAAAAGRSQAGS